MNDRDYFRQRAEDELRLASQSRLPEVARVHYELAGLYLDRVHRSDTSAAVIARLPM